MYYSCRYKKKQQTSCSRLVLDYFERQLFSIDRFHVNKLQRTSKWRKALKPPNINTIIMNNIYEKYRSLNVSFMSCCWLPGGRCLGWTHSLQYQFNSSRGHSTVLLQSVCVRRYPVTNCKSHVSVSLFANITIIIMRVSFDKLCVPKCVHVCITLHGTAWHAVLSQPFLYVFIA